MSLLFCRYQKRVSNIIDDVLEWSPRLALSGIMEKQQPHIYDNKLLILLKEAELLKTRPCQWKILALMNK